MTGERLCIIMDAGSAIDADAQALAIKFHKQQADIGILADIAQRAVHRIAVIFGIFERTWPNNLHKPRVAGLGATVDIAVVGRGNEEHLGFLDHLFLGIPEFPVNALVRDGICRASPVMFILKRTHAFVKEGPILEYIHLAVSLVTIHSVLHYRTGLMVEEAALAFQVNLRAVGNGVGAGVAALIVCLQPVITAVLVGPLLGERVSRRQWLGMALGLGGVALVVSHKLVLDIGSVDGMAWAFLGLMGITFGTLYQKKYCADMDSRSGAAIQFLVAAIVLTPLALIFEERIINWTPTLIISLAYIAIVLSLISMILLTIMIRRGEASRMTSWFFLIPPTATVLAWLVLDEPIGMIAWIGMVIAAAGVALVMAPEQTQV